MAVVSSLRTPSAVPCANRTPKRRQVMRSIFVLPCLATGRRSLRTGEPRRGLCPLESARRGPRPLGQREHRWGRPRAGLFARWHTAGGGQQHRYLALRCPHRRRSRPVHGTYGLGGVLAGRDHPRQWRSGRNGCVVGRGQRAGDSLSPREYVLGQFGGVLAGRHHFGQWQLESGCVVGRGQRAGDGHPPREYVLGQVGGVLAGRHHPRQWR